MAKLAMKRIEIAVVLEDGKSLLEFIQRRGVVEVSDSDSCEKLDTSPSVQRFERSIQTAVQARSVLREYVPEKGGGLRSMLQGKRTLSDSEYEAAANMGDRYLQDCYEILRLNKKIAEYRAATVRARTQLDALQNWLALDIPMQYKGTRHTRCFIGSFPDGYSEEKLLQKFAETEPELEAVSVTVVFVSREQTIAAIFCCTEDVEKVQEMLRGLGFSRPPDPTKHPPEVRARRYEEEIRANEERIDACIEKIKSYADCAENIEFAIDYLSMKRDRYLALGKFALTQSTLILNGYIPQRDSVKLARELEKKYCAAVTLSDPEEEADVPVLLENSQFSAPVESITEMFALPSSKDIDPSPVMAFFYYLLFGMMLSDAGYGLIMVIGTAIALRKLQGNNSMRKMLQMFFYCGISTVFWGVLFGSWFGDLIPVIGREFFNTQLPSLALWYEPINDPMTLLLFSFGLGIIHLFLGLSVKFYLMKREEGLWEACCEVIPVMLLILGAAPLAAGILTPVPAVLGKIGTYLAAAGAILIILTAGRNAKNIFARLGGGVYGLYNAASGYLSDILSYSRLLALGLATGSIASVINLMCVMPENTVVKAIVMVVAGIVGHTLNMAINLLGAYVHTNRLQFVELFSKFYEGGGRMFAPLKTETNYITLEK